MISIYFEGTCPLGQYGYSRDKEKGKLQIIFGLLCNVAAWTIAVSALVRKLKQKAHLDRMYVVRTSVCAKVLDDSETVKAIRVCLKSSRNFAVIKLSI